MRFSKANNDAWISDLDMHIKDHIDNAGFTSNHLAQLMNMSQRQLYRKMKDLMDTTPNEYLKQIRFHKAEEYLQQQKYATISELAYAVGFKDVVYFSRQFKKQFGKLPSAYLE